MNLGIQGKRALIFGGSRGVGRAVAMALAAEGVDVAVCARKEWAARKVASEAVAASGIKAAGYGIDAWDEPSAVDLVDRIVSEFGAIDILFGIARRASIQDRNDLSTSAWQSHIENGFLRFKAATEVLLSGMRLRKWGRILWMIPCTNRGTAAARRAHSVTGAALCAWLKSLSVEVADDGVTLNILKSTPVLRDPMNNLPLRIRQSHPATANRAFGHQAPSVPQAASVAAFLVSDLAGGVWGRTIRLGGQRRNRA